MTLFAFLLLMILPLMSSAGYIYLSNTDISYQNAKYAQNFTFILSLESGLSSSDYIYVKFPFSLGTFASTSTLPKASISLLSNTITEKLYPAQGFSDMNYFFNFAKDLPSNSWLSLKLIASDSSILLQNEGYQGIIEIYTVSSLSPNRIYYDSNTVFEHIQLAGTPSNDLLGNCTIHKDNNSISMNPNAILTSFFDLQINEENKFGNSIQFVMNDQAFRFVGACSLMTCSVNVDYPNCINNITALNFKTTCTIVNTNQITLKIDSSIPKNTNLRLKTFIQNPLFIKESPSTSYIEIRQISNASPMILNNIKVFCGLYVSKISITSNIVQLFWGLQTTGLINNEGCPIVLYKLPTSPKIIPWNNIKLIFSIAKTTPIYPLQAKIDLTTSFQDILTGSISSNIPSYLSTTMKCQIQSIQYLSCGNFSNLIASTSYYISFKITIKNTISSTISLGGIQFLDANNGMAYTNSFSPSDSLTVLLNTEYLDEANYGVNSAGTYGGYNNINYNQLVSFDDDDDLIYYFGKADNGFGVGDMISKSLYGISSIFYPTASQSTQRIIAFLQVSSLKMCQDILNRCSTTSSNADHTMLKVVFNNNILGITSENLSKGVELIDSLFADVTQSINIKGCVSGGWCSQYNTYSAQTSKINQIFEKTASSVIYNGYHHLTVVCQTPSGSSQKMCHQIVGRDRVYGSGGNRPGFSAFAFRGVTIASYPSMYSDSSSLDFIMCFKYQSYSISGISNVASTDESEWTLSTSGVIPSYIITGGFYSSYLKVSWINYYAKTGDGMTSDNYLPFILRISGQFDDEDPTTIFSANTVSIFLDSAIDITAYKEGPSTESSSDLIYCGSPDGTLDCKVYPRIGSVATQQDVWTNEQRIEFDYQFSIDTYFNFYIPIKPTFISNVIGALNSLSLGIMTIDEYGERTIDCIYRLVGSVAMGDYNFAAMQQANSKFEVSTGFWSGIGANLNCSNGGFPNFDTSISLKPNSKYTDTFRVNTQITGNGNENCMNNKEGSAKNGWGTAFTMASDVNIFESITEMQWDFEGEVDYVVTNVCVFFNYRIPALNKRIYTIVCPIDTYSGIQSPTIGGWYKYLTLFSMTWPWWWGDSSMPSNVIRYGWSKSNGLLAAYRSESTRVYSQTTCFNSDVLIMRGVQAWKYSIMVTPGIVVNLNSTTNFDVFFLRITNLTSLKFLEFEDCEFVFKNYSFNCATSTSFSFVDFYITYNGEGKIALDSLYYINVYLSNEDVQINDVYYLKIYSPVGFYKENFVVDTCSSALFETNPNPSLPSSNMTIGNLSYITSNNVLTTFSFSLNTLLRNLHKGTQIRIFLGFLSVLEVSFRMECRVYKDFNTSFIDFRWGSIDILSGREIYLTPKSDINTSHIFTVRCFGGKTPASNFNPENFSSQSNKINSNIAIQTSNQLRPLTNISQPYDFTSLELTKNFSYMGFEANYFFSFKLYRGEINTDGRIVVLFPKKIPNILNSNEFFKCYLNKFLVFCNLTEENLLSVSCNIFLNYTTHQTYTLDVYGVSQPNISITSEISSLDRKIAIMIDDDDDIKNGVSVYGEVNDNFTYMSSSVLTKSIKILDMNFSQLITRKLTDLYIRIQLGPLAIIAGNSLYIQFDKVFYTALLQTYNVECFLYNEQDITNSINYVVKNCLKIDILKIEMILSSSDTNNFITQNYHLWLKQLPTPIYFPTQSPPLFKIFYISNSSSNIEIYQTAVGFFNASFPGFNQSNSLDLYWYYYQKENDTFLVSSEQYFDIYVGRYSSLIGLGIKTGVFNLTYNYSLSGPDSSNFIIYPSYNPSVIKGIPINSFYIAAKYNVTPGVYFLTFSKLNGGDSLDWNSPIPPLLVNVNAGKCRINSPESTYQVPIGKTSFPIYLDFSTCTPVDNIIIFANITFGYDEYHLSFIDTDNSLTQSLNQTIDFANGGYPQVYFTVRNQDIYQNLTVNLTGNVSFKIYGTNANSYIPPADVQLKLVDSISFKTPPIPSIPKIETYANTVKITIKCSQPSRIFYCLRTIKFDSSFNYKTIEAKTSSVNTYQTLRDSSDPYWNIYGYKVQNNYNSLSLNISNLKSQATYYFSFFCLNRFSVISPIGPNTSWVQNDNSGRITKLSFTFNGNLSLNLRYEIACSLTEILSMSNEQVLDYNGNSCAMKRILSSLNTTNTTILASSIINSSNESTTIPNIDTKQNIFVYFVMPNYELLNETIQTVIKTKVSNMGGGLGFAGLVLSNTNKLSSFPSLTNFSYFTYENSEKYAPKINISNPSTSNSSLSFYLSLNQSGFIVLALDTNSSNKPSFDNLKNGMNKVGQAISLWEIFNINKGEIFNKTYTDLNESSQYYLWFATWNDDPSINKINSSVSQLNLKTNTTLKKVLNAMKRSFEIIYLLGLILISYLS